MFAVPVPSRARACALAAVALLAAGGCGRLHHKASTAPTRDVVIEVRNDLTPPSDLTVYLVDVDGGNQRLLGGVPPNETKTLTTPRAPISAQFRLVANRVSGRPIRSQPFIIDPDVLHLSWELSQNSLVLFGPSP